MIFSLSLIALLASFGLHRATASGEGEGWGSWYSNVSNDPPGHPYRAQQAEQPAQNPGYQLPPQQGIEPVFDYNTGRWVVPHGGGSAYKYPQQPAYQYPPQQPSDYGGSYSEGPDPSSYVWDHQASQPGIEDDEQSYVEEQEEETTQGHHDPDAFAAQLGRLNLGGGRKGRATGEAEEQSGSLTSRLFGRKNKGKSTVREPQTARVRGNLENVRVSIPAPRYDQGTTEAAAATPRTEPYEMDPRWTREMWRSFHLAWAQHQVSIYMEPDVIASHILQIAHDTGLGEMAEDMARYKIDSQGPSSLHGLIRNVDKWLKHYKERAAEGREPEPSPTSTRSAQSKETMKRVWKAFIKDKLKPIYGDTHISSIPIDHLEHLSRGYEGGGQNLEMTQYYIRHYIRKVLQRTPQEIDRFDTERAEYDQQRVLEEQAMMAQLEASTTERAGRKGKGKLRKWLGKR